VQSIIRDQCADRMHISELAQQVALDMRYLISLFKLATGVTPHQFQIAMRVELARALLQQHLPLCEVAARAGFADQSHLNRHFRRQYGFTPGEFRESVVTRPSIVL
jgi:transcriptional regulator GlxA family with amidase domain